VEEEETHSKGGCAIVSTEPGKNDICMAERAVAVGGQAVMIVFSLSSDYV
jgi:hypothetical protein